jgi:hypothetical protein
VVFLKEKVVKVCKTIAPSGVFDTSVKRLRQEFEQCCSSQVEQHINPRPLEATGVLYDRTLVLMKHVFFATPASKFGHSKQQQVRMTHPQQLQVSTRIVLRKHVC